MQHRNCCLLASFKIQPGRLPVSNSARAAENNIIITHQRFANIRCRSPAIRADRGRDIAGVRDALYAQLPRPVVAGHEAWPDDGQAPRSCRDAQEKMVVGMGDDA